MTDNSLDMQVQLYCSAIIFACDAYVQKRKVAEENRLADYRAGFRLTETKQVSVTKSRGWWFWKKTWTELQEIPTTEQERERERAYHKSYEYAFRAQIPDKITQLRAIAAHHKPSTLLTIRGEELALISTYLAPSESFADGNVSGRV